MDLNTLREKEQTYLERFLVAVQLPNYFKTVGWISLILTFIGFFVVKATMENPEFARVILRKVFLLAMLTIALAKEKVEDEMITQIRAKAFSISFILGVFYAVFQPFVEYFMSNLLNPEKANFIEQSDLGTFQLLSFMLLIYIGFFQVLKRNC